MGNSIPVDAFSPKTKAKIKMMIIPMPLIPDFEKPRINAANTIAAHCKDDKL